jgi:hypothetical protein
VSRNLGHFAFPQIGAKLKNGATFPILQVIIGMILLIARRISDVGHRSKLHGKSSDTIHRNAEKGGGTEQGDNGVSVREQGKGHQDGKATGLANGQGRGRPRGRGLEACRAQEEAGAASGQETRHMTETPADRVCMAGDAEVDIVSTMD